MTLLGKGQLAWQFHSSCQMEELAIGVSTCGGPRDTYQLVQNFLSVVDNPQLCGDPNKINRNVPHEGLKVLD